MNITTFVKATWIIGFIALVFLGTLFAGAQLPVAAGITGIAALLILGLGLR